MTDLLIDKCRTLKQLATTASVSASNAYNSPAALFHNLTAVGDLRAAAETAGSALSTAVERARREGASWEQIAHELHVTRQAAWERFGK